VSDLRRLWRRELAVLGSSGIARYLCLSFVGDFAWIVVLLRLRIVSTLLKWIEHRENVAIQATQDAEAQAVLRIEAEFVKADAFARRPLRQRLAYVMVGCGSVTCLQRLDESDEFASGSRVAGPVPGCDHIPPLGVSIASKR
jgi:hypothetical protein